LYLNNSKIKENDFIIVNYYCRHRKMDEFIRDLTRFAVSSVNELIESGDAEEFVVVDCVDFDLLQTHFASVLVSLLDNASVIESEDERCIIQVGERFFLIVYETQSFDDGVTWETEFSFHNCESLVDAQSVEARNRAREDLACVDYVE